MKKFFSMSKSGCLSAMLIALTLVSCFKTTVMTTGISVDSASLIMLIGETKNLTAKVEPSDATDKDVVWTSTNPEVVSVSSTGLVTAIAPGVATIVVCSSCGGYTATCRVSVVDPVSGISLDKKEVTLYENEFVDLAATLKTRDESNKKVIWRTTADSLVTVHEGRVTARRAPVDGKPVGVIAFSEDEKFNDVCLVTVKCHVSGVSFSQNSLSLVIGESFDLEPEILPLRATDKSYKIESSNPAAVSVSQEGVVTALAETEEPVEITLTSNDEIADNLFRKAVCKVTVKHSALSPSGINILKDGTPVNSFDMFVGDSKATLVAHITPENVDNRTVTWLSSNPEVVSVENGTESNIVIVSALKNGSAEIIASTQDKGLVASCKVNVYTRLLSIDVKPLGEPLGEMWQGDTRELQCVIKPADASVGPVEWSVSDPSVAKISGNSLYACKANGSDIVVTAKVGCLYSTSDIREKSITVKVKCHVEEVRLNRHTLALEAGAVSNELSVSVLPENATDKGVTWSSSDPNIVKVDSATGEITAAENPSDKPAYVIVRSADGSKEDRCEVSVFRSLKGLAIYCDGSKVSSTLNLSPADTKTLVAKPDPEDASNPVISWKTGNDEVATIDDSGRLKAVANGETSIFAIADNGLSAQCVVKVSTAVAGISFDQSTLVSEMYQGDSPVKLSVKFEPETASDKSLTWTSSNEKVLYVSGDGALTPVVADPDVSSVRITATSANGKSCSCDVSVKCHVSALSMSESTYSLQVGKTVRLSAKVFPENATNKDLTWSSGNSGVASVSSDGLVNALKVGTAEIVAKSKENNEISCKCKVEVIDKSVPVTGIQVYPESLKLAVGESGAIAASITPSNASNRNIEWTSSDNSIATVKDGRVTAMGIGSVKITATSADNKNVSAVCNVTVSNEDPGVVHVTGVSLNKTTLALTVGGSETLTATVSPSNASDKSVIWTTSNASVATVLNGKVTAKAVGTAVITVKTNDGGFSKTCTVSVSESRITSMTLSPSSLSLEVGSGKQLDLSVTPSTAPKTGLEWKSTNTSVATVSSSGYITAKGAGEARITVTAPGGVTSNECIVTVVKAVKHVTRVLVSPSNLDLYPGQDTVLTVRVDPEDATNKEVIWEVNGGGVIVSNGRVTATKAGSSYTIVTVSSVDNPSCKNSCIINTIALKAEGMTLDRTAISLKTGDKARLEPVFKPVNTTDKTVTWATDNNSVVTVADGVITAQGEGTATVTATSRDGGFTAVCRVTVSAGGAVGDNKNQNVDFGDLN